MGWCISPTPRRANPYNRDTAPLNKWRLSPEKQNIGHQVDFGHHVYGPDTPKLFSWMSLNLVMKLKELRTRTTTGNLSIKQERKEEEVSSTPLHFRPPCWVRDGSTTIARHLLVTRQRLSDIRRTEVRRCGDGIIHFLHVSPSHHPRRTPIRCPGHSSFIPVTASYSNN